MKKLNLLFFILVFVAFCSCRKDPAWEISSEVPLLNAELGLENIFSDSVLDNSSDSCPKLVFDKRFYSLTADSIVSIPDSLYYLNFALPFSTEVAPGALIYSKTENKYYKFNGAKLTDVRIKKGKLEIIAYNKVGSNAYIEYKINNSSKNGSPILLTAMLPPTDNLNGPYHKYFDISETYLNLRGSYLHCNSLSSTFKLYADPMATHNIQINYGNNIFILVRFTDIQLEYAKGYFGQHDLPQNDTAAFNLLSDLGLSYLDIDNASMSLKITNNIGADVSFKLNKLSSIGNKTVNLNSKWIGQIVNLARATQNTTNEIVSKSNAIINFDDANIENFIENLPQKIAYNLDVSVNPLGNNNSGNDFVKYGNGLYIDAHVEIPLNIAFSNLILKDTLNCNIKKNESYLKKACLNFDVSNGFPIDISLNLYFINSNGLTIDSITNIDVKSANIDVSGAATSPTISHFRENLSEAQTLHLYESKKVAVEVVLNSGSLANQRIKLSPDNRIKINVKSLFDYYIGL